MSYQSKYYDFARTPDGHWRDGWTKQTFTRAVKHLETLSRDELLVFCRLPGIELTFLEDDWERTISDEELIGALLSDHSAYELLSALASLTPTHHRQRQPRGPLGP